MSTLRVAMFFLVASLCRNCCLNDVLSLNMSHSVETRFTLEVREGAPHVLASTADAPPYSALITNIRFLAPRAQQQRKDKNADASATDGDDGANANSTVYSLVMVGKGGKVEKEFTVASFEHHTGSNAIASSSTVAPQPTSINTQLVLTSKSPIQQIHLRSSRPRKGASAKRLRAESDEEAAASKKLDACVFLTGVQLTTLTDSQVSALIR